MTERDERQLLSGAYALNSLEKAERAEFEAILAQSEEVRTEVAELSEAAALLGASSPPVAPSPELKSNLMALIAVTPQLSPTVPSRPVAVPSIEQQRSIRDLASTKPHSAEARAQASWYRKPLNVLVTAAAAIALVAGGFVLGQGISNPATQLAQANSLAELSAADDLQRSMSDVSGGGSATLVWSDALQRSAMLIEGLPELAADRVYQLWYIDESGATSAGTFTASSAGTTWRVLEGTNESADAVGLTIEPQGGSSEPTTTPIVVIEDA